MWLPINSLKTDNSSSSRNSLFFIDQHRVPEVMLHAWEEDTQEMYGSHLENGEHIIKEKADKIG